jgi:hypothetical protein
MFDILMMFFAKNDESAETFFGIFFCLSSQTNSQHNKRTTNPSLFLNRIQTHKIMASLVTVARAGTTTSTHRSSGLATRGKFSYRKSQSQQNFATTIPNNKNNSKSGQRHSSVVLHSRMKVSANAAGGETAFQYKKPRIDEGYNCVVTEKGAIISEDIPSGTYEVSAWWGGTKKSRDDKEEEFLAPRCDTERQKGCEVKCEVVEEGCLVCEGLAEGTYRVTNVKDLNEECEVSYDGTSISCDEADAETFDVGDLEMQEKADDHSIRLGG